MKILNKKNIAFILFVLPALAIYTFVMPIPIICSIINSFYDWDIISRRIFIGFDNYIEIFDNAVFHKALRNIGFIAAFSIVVQVSVGLTLAYFIVSLKRFKGFFQNVFFIPNVLSTATVGVLWLFIYDSRIGLINVLLKTIGLEQFQKSWLANTRLTLFLIMIAASWQYIGYYMMLYIAAIANIPIEVMEAAKLDGVGKFRMMWSIIIPMISPIIKVTVTLILVGSVKFFDLMWVMTLGGPNHASETVSTMIVNDVFTKLRYGYGSALSTVLFVICILLTFVLNRIFNEKESY